MTGARVPLASFATFGELLKFLRRRAQLSQLELSIAVGYSAWQIYTSSACGFQPQACC
ncbi:MAG: hypothetical protein QG637_1473, partial [Chloroflexota bacterium]|nr:hypothetical protein [Chloroflexota bacterium]